VQEGRFGKSDEDGCLLGKARRKDDPEARRPAGKPDHTTPAGVGERWRTGFLRYGYHRLHFLRAVVFFYASIELKEAM
jgi:hypothetical protein